ncbi:hypothetical protein PIB30_105227, partial [Stylosanthes scabra]|nr:hypothetical protein [Stylosanthes scabra]
MDDFRPFLQEQRVYQKQQATQMANLTEILAGLVTQNTNNTPTSSQPSSSSTLPSQPFPNPKGSINAISFQENSLELEAADDEEEEFLKILEEISMKDDVGFEESEGIIELGTFSFESNGIYATFTMGDSIEEKLVEHPILWCELNKTVVVSTLEAKPEKLIEGKAS